jgi:P27 family predicted phage terminase small subunit
MGRRPKTRAQRILEGNPGKRPLPPELTSAGRLADPAHPPAPIAGPAGGGAVANAAAHDPRGNAASSAAAGGAGSKDGGSIADLAEGAEVPGWLDELGRAEWHRVAEQLRTLGLLATTSRQTLAMCCHWFSLYREAARQVKQDGMVFKTETGQIKKNPAVGVMHMASNLYLRFAIELGMTPASRGSVQAIGGQQELPGMPPKPELPATADPDARFFGTTYGAAPPVKQ